MREAQHLAARGRARGPDRQRRASSARRRCTSSLHEAGSPIGLATVYRALADLATEGEADSLQQEGESLYRACTPGSHHHHLICRNCGLTVEIAADAVEPWARQVAAAHGFTQPQHVVDVFGLCAACSAQIDLAATASDAVGLLHWSSGPLPLASCADPPHL